METEIPPVPAVDCPPGPAIPAPEPVPVAPANTVSVIPPNLAERVTIGPAPSWVVEHPVDAEALKHIGANPILLLDEQLHGERHERYERTVRRLDTTRAVHEAAQWRLDFDPATQHLTIHSLTVRRGDRTVENAQASRLRVLQREENLDRLIIDGVSTVVVLLEDVRGGDVLDLSYTLHSVPRIFPTHFWGIVSIPAAMPVREFHFRVRFSTTRALRWKSNDPKLTPVVKEEQGETDWAWQVSNVAGTEPEGNVPGWHFVDRWNQVSDFASWAEVAAGMVAAWPEELQSPEIRERVEAITADADSPAQRAERALTFLQDEIRYLSLNTEFGGQIPTAPSVIIKRGFGDCKDKAFAAAHLLRLLGIPARPVLVHTQLCQAVREFLPLPDAFNHAVVEYKIDERRRTVDVTASHQGGSALSRPTAQFQAGLPLAPGVTDLETFGTDEISDHIELQETFRLDTRGRESTLSVLITASGREAEKWRRSLAHDGVEAFARAREQFYQQIYPGTQRAGKLKWRDDRETNELVLAETFNLHDILFQNRDGSFHFRFTAHAIQAVLGFYESAKRQHPWELRFPCRLEHTIEIDSSSLPQHLTRSVQSSGNAFRYSSTIQQRPGFASVTYVVQMLADHVPAAQFEEYKKKVRAIWPNMIVTGELPTGSMVPWKSRSTETVLPRTNHRKLPKTPRETGPEATNPATPAAGATLGNIAPPLSSKPAREKGAVSPRKENASRTAEPAGTRERSGITRPNPSLPPPNPGPRISSSQMRRNRRARETRDRLIMFALVVLGALILAGMMAFLVRPH